MREILFRGKKEYGFGWCYGSYNNGVITTEKLTVGDIDISGSELEECAYTNDFFEVYTDTVGQYTGCKDKNGTKIFEGDIIKFNYPDDKENYFISEVKCVYGVFEVDDKQDDIYNGSCPIAWINDELELTVIGNVHDNPIRF